MDYEVHLFIFLSLIFANLPGSEATKFCYTKFCADECCGDVSNNYCCSSSLSDGEIAGIIFGCCVIGVIIAVIVCVEKISKGSGRRVQPQRTIIYNTGQPQMQYHPRYKPPSYAQSQAQPSPAYPPPAAMYNHPPQSNPPPPGFQTTPQANYSGAPHPGNPPPPGFVATPQAYYSGGPHPGNPPPPGFQATPQANYSGGQNPGKPPAPGFIATQTGGSQGQQPNPFAQAAQKSS